MTTTNEPIRELFIEELAEVTGGGGDLKEKIQWLADQLKTTMACGEEVPDSC